MMRKAPVLSNLATSAVLSVIAAVQVPALAATGPGDAAQAYPDKPIRLMVPYAPGGNTDILARVVGQRLTDSWGKQVVVDNRGSANGIVATEISARATPDGHTVFVGSTREISVNPTLYSKLPYNVQRDFLPVTMGTITPILVAAHPSLPAKTFNDVIAQAKTKAVSYGSPGIGTSMHLAGEYLKMLTGSQLVHIPYNGGGPAAAAVLSGQEVQFGLLGMGPAIPFVKAGRIRPLALTTAKRATLLPDVPTLQELGFKDFEINIWFAFFVPTRTPASVVKKLNGEIVRILKSKETNAYLLNTGVEIDPGTPQQLAQTVKADEEKYRKIIRAAGIKPE
jgi:tripartite-type tricarboxylate transporter receptor subunit TctC